MVDRPRAIHLDLLPLASPLQVESLSTLSHELRTPLNVILGFAEMLEDPECDEAQRGQLLHRIKAAAAGLVELVDRSISSQCSRIVSTFRPRTRETASAYS